VARWLGSAPTTQPCCLSNLASAQRAQLWRAVSCLTHKLCREYDPRWAWSAIAGCGLHPQLNAARFLPCFLAQQTSAHTNDATVHCVHADHEPRRTTCSLFSCAVCRLHMSYVTHAVHADHEPCWAWRSGWSAGHWCAVGGSLDLDLMSLAATVLSEQSCERTAC
jgi:hypothetical protein